MPVPAPEPPATATHRAGATRRDPWLFGALALALLVARIVLTWREAHEPVRAAIDRVHWVAPEAAVAVAQAQHKPILYEFSAAWCGPCQTMQREVFSQERWARQIEAYAVPVRVVDRQQEDGHNSALVDSLQHACAVSAFPTLALVSNGLVVDQNEGYPGPELTMKWLVRAASKAGEPAPGVHIEFHHH